MGRKKKNQTAAPSPQSLPLPTGLLPVAGPVVPGTAGALEQQQVAAMAALDAAIMGGMHAAQVQQQQSAGAQLGAAGAAGDAGDGGGFVGAGVPAPAEPLPIEAHKDEIMDHVDAHKVTMIRGETGCGKSTMVPQFILERDPSAVVLVTQPRRIAVLNLARRVSAQLGTQIGGRVGYRMSREVKGSRDRTQVWFATTGYVLEWFSHNPKEAERFTHIVLDEIHERSLDGDLLCMVLRRLMRRDGLAHKLIVMSATLEAGKFARYFHPEDPPAEIFVGARRFPVEDVYLEDLPHAVPLSPAGLVTHGQVLSKFVNASRRVRYGVSDNRANQVLKPAIDHQVYELAAHIVFTLVQPGECVLIFLPGLSEIYAMNDTFIDNVTSDFDTSVELIVLHSTSPREEQDAAFVPTPADCRRVILSTNIAESSVTVPDVRYIINFCQHREMAYEEARGLSYLARSWCSKASIKQRSGRAGRLFPGTVFHLVARSFMDAYMPDYDLAEICRVSLENVVLRTKLQLSDWGTVESVLRDLCDPPSKRQIRNAFDALRDAGALTRTQPGRMRRGADDPEDEGRVTLFGRIAAALPVSVMTTRVIFYGLVGGTVLEAIIMGCAVAAADPFTQPSALYERDDQALLAAVADGFQWRRYYDRGDYSEPISYLRLYIDWLSHRSLAFTKSRGSSFRRLRELDGQVVDVALRLAKLLRSLQRDTQSPYGSMVGKLPGDPLVALESTANWNERRALPWNEVLASFPNGGQYTADDVLWLKCTLAGAAMPDHILVGNWTRDFDGMNLGVLDRDRVLSILPGGREVQAAIEGSFGRPQRQTERGGALFVQYDHDAASVLSAKTVKVLKRKGGPKGKGKAKGEAEATDPEAGAEAGSEDASAVVKERNQLIRDVAPPAQLILQYAMVRNPNRKNRIPIPVQPVPGQPQPESAASVSVAAVRPPARIKWTDASGLQTFVNFRCPLGTASETRKDLKSHVAVTMSLIGTESARSARATGTTLLPSTGSQSLAMMLIFQSEHSALTKPEMVIDRGLRIHALHVGASNLVHTARWHAINSEELDEINAIRANICSILDGDMHPIRGPIIALLNKLATVTDEDDIGEDGAILDAKQKSAKQKKEKKAPRDLEMAYVQLALDHGRTPDTVVLEGDAETSDKLLNLLPPIVRPEFPVFDDDLDDDTDDEPLDGQSEMILEYLARGGYIYDDDSGYSTGDDYDDGFDFY